MKKSYWIMTLAAGLMIGCSGQKTEETENTEVVAEAPAEEWISLFDGQTFSGWHKYGGGEVGKAWKVADGTLYLDAANKDGWQTGDGGDIVTDEEFENFHLKYEWKIAPNGNSGVIFFGAFIFCRYICVRWPYNFSFHHVARLTVGSLNFLQAFDVYRIILVFFF